MSMHNVQVFELKPIITRRATNNMCGPCTRPHDKNKCENQSCKCFRDRLAMHNGCSHATASIRRSPKWRTLLRCLLPGTPNESRPRATSPGATSPSTRRALMAHSNRRRQSVPRRTTRPKRVSPTPVNLSLRPVSEDSPWFLVGTCPVHLGSVAPR